MTGSVRSQFVTGLARLDRIETRSRLLTVRRAVHARIDEVRDMDVKHALLAVSDEVDRALHAASRNAVERLAEGLAVSDGEPPTRRPVVPSANPRR